MNQQLPRPAPRVPRDDLSVAQALMPWFIVGLLMLGAIACWFES